MAITEIVTLLKDILLGGAAITGAFIANKGLTTWKRQHKGNSEYELSRRILVTLYKYRDAIDGVRHPAIWENEMPSPPEEKIKSMTGDEIRGFTEHEWPFRLDGTKLMLRELAFMPTYYKLKHYGTMS